MTHMVATGGYVKEILFLSAGRVGVGGHGMAEVKLLCYKWLSTYACVELVSKIQIHLTCKQSIAIHNEKFLLQLKFTFKLIGVFRYFFLFILSSVGPVKE
jgi:hypothetical protein